MSFFILGFFTGLSLILAIGAQNIFVIEQGLKKQFVFIVCAICAMSDFLLIFLGNFSKSFFTYQKLLFGFGATLSSIIFFFILGYLSKFLSNYLNSNKVWKIINISIILFMTAISIYVLINILG